MTGILNGQSSFQAPEIEAGKLCSIVPNHSETTVFWIMQVNNEGTAAAVRTRAGSLQKKWCQSERTDDALGSLSCIGTDLNSMTLE
jgi:hypothetical protein